VVHAIRVVGTLLVLAAASMSVPCGLRAEEPASVTWHNDVALAWSAASQHGRPMLVFVTCPNCRFCDKMKQGTFARPDMAETINRAFVPLAVDGGSDAPLVKELNVKYYPATFIISPQAVILARIDGYVSPEQFTQHLVRLQVPSAEPNVARGR
jgi:thioredoxin-related protein